MNPIFSVSELTNAIKKQLESTFLFVKVKGEVSNLKHQSSGHIYFSLKDANSQISAVLFQGYAKTLTKLPKDGDQIIVEGELSVYAPRGTYQIVVRKVEFDGVGALLLKLHALKEELRTKGWFEPSRKKPLPHFPKTIGVVTSPTGAVIRDIIHVLSRRAKSFQLILNPVKVQGEGAAEEIALAIDDFNKWNLADVLIVGRGGGSLEDLMPFNERCVAEAIYRSKIPVISAVGHETDFSIADFVADVRAPTPSAAAEIVTKETAALLTTLQKGQSVLQNLIAQIVKKHRYQIEKISSHPKFADPYYLLGTFGQKVDDMEEALTLSLEQKVQKARYRLETKRQIFANTNLQNIISQKRKTLQRLSEHLTSLNPKNILKKGYCIPFRENKDSVIISSKELNPSQKLSLLFHDGSAKVEVIHV